jgi:UMF1 family MFS transporter
MTVEKTNFSKKGIIGWCLYDWANSAYPTVIATFVFAAYVSKGVAESPESGQAAWGYAMGLSGFLIAILGPIFGGLADQRGHHKYWIAAFMAFTLVPVAALWGIAPAPEYLLPALALVVIANSAFEIGTIYYNAMLPALVPKNYYGRISGWAWGIGYAGGLACLLAALFLLVKADPPPFGLDTSQAEHIRATAPLVAIWFLVFSLPLFLWTPSPKGQADQHTIGDSIALSIKTLWHTLKTAKQNKTIFQFLLARMIYIDGLNTLFAFGGIYAAGTFNMNFEEIIMFGIAMNVTAGLGAFAFAWIDDWIGARKTILISLAGMIMLGCALLVIESKTMFWALALPLGIFMGPTQSASRSMMAHLAPENLRGEMFGLYALSGKATAFIGPLMLGLATDIFSSQRAGMATIVIFMVAGGILLWRTPSHQNTP